MRISVVIPALDESANIQACLEPLQSARAEGHEVLVVDGGSSDDTTARAEPLADRVLTGSHGRAGQMNHGARVASGDVLWFLHADTRVGPEQFRLLPVVCHGGRRIWGRFDVRLDASGAAFRMIATGMNLRSRWTGIATGDQAMFVTRRLFEAVGGFPEWPLMEDLALSRALRDRVFPVCFRERVTTSARRWQDNGIWRTIWLMWRLRFAFYMGADPEVLHQRYNGTSA